MTRLNFTFIYDNQTSEVFHLIGSHGSLPFPFHLSYNFRLLISAAMALNFVGGTYLRVNIGRFLLEQSNKMGPINLLIWIDQFNGLFLAVNILGRVVSFALPFPMSHITGDTFCTWSPLPGLSLCNAKESFKSIGMLV